MAKIAIIPARGGSKRIPGKNVRELAGRPMIAYTIEAACASGLFERVVVSTDSQEIAEIAERYGAESPFLRDAGLADDVTPVSLATLDALQRLDPDGGQYDTLAQLMPNCPVTVRRGCSTQSCAVSRERQPIADFCCSLRLAESLVGYAPQ